MAEKVIGTLRDYITLDFVRGAARDAVCGGTDGG